MMKRWLIFPICAVLLTACTATEEAKPLSLWQQFMDGIQTAPARDGDVKMNFSWQAENQTATMIAEDGNGRIMFYQFSREQLPQAEGPVAPIQCQFLENGLYCPRVGGEVMFLVVSNDGDLWSGLANQAVQHMDQADALAQLSQGVSVADELALIPYVDLYSQRHPFEFGYDYETIENAQHFIESTSLMGLYWGVSTLPRPPQLAYSNLWVDDNVYQSRDIEIATVEPCLSRITISGQRVRHYIRNMFTDNEFESASYDVTFMIDWSALSEFTETNAGVKLAGQFDGIQTEDVFRHVNGWQPLSFGTLKTKPFDPKEYTAQHWNLDLLIRNTLIMRDRIVFAMMMLNVKCQQLYGKG